ncbi:hypothetical protein MY11210_009195 [Beauveria gryllotalpidicola]
MSDSHIVLGIPVPRCAQALALTPPALQPIEADYSVIKLVKAYGKANNKGEAEIQYECHLAEGLSDFVIILERPYVKNYYAKFEDIVRDSATLRGVDEVIRFCTKGARSIYTTTVLNAFAMEPDKGIHDRDAQWHQCLARILQLKKPRVILQCHRDVYKNEWMSRFYFGASDYTFHQCEVALDQHHTALVIQSFHPSCAVNNTQCRPEYRALLIHHVLAAFAALSGKTQLPSYVEEIRQLCLTKGQRRKVPRLQYWEAAHYISDALTKGYHGIETCEPVEFADDSRDETLQRRAGRVGGMYARLETLRQGACTPGALAIAKTMTFFWKDHFSKTPIYAQVMRLLRTRGVEQPGWFATTTTTTSHEKSLPTWAKNVDLLKISLETIGILCQTSQCQEPNSYIIKMIAAAANSAIPRTTVSELDASSLVIACSVSCCEIMMGLAGPESLIDDRDFLERWRFQLTMNKGKEETDHGKLNVYSRTFWDQM